MLLMDRLNETFWVPSHLGSCFLTSLGLGERKFYWKIPGGCRVPASGCSLVICPNVPHRGGQGRERRPKTACVLVNKLTSVVKCLLWKDCIRACPALSATSMRKRSPGSETLPALG